MTRLTTIEPTTADSAAKPLLDAVNRKLGVVPNLMRVLAINPAILGAYLAFSGAVTGASLGGKLHAQIALAVAEANGCSYCLAAHTVLGGGAGLSETEIISARKGQAADARAAAALAFARALVAERGAVSQNVLARARTALTDAEIVEIVAAVALNILTNYINLAADTEIDFPPVVSLRGAA